jgi:serine/threonine-protein phosphatase 2A regulatory subunit A
LNDNVYSIRVAAIENLKTLTTLFGSNWAENYIIKAMLDLKTETNYLHRLTPLFGIAELSQVISSDIVKKSFNPVLV